MRSQGNHQLIPIAVCFFEQNPISLSYLSRLLRGREFEVLGEEEAYEREKSAPERQLVVAIDERILLPESRLTMRSLRARFPRARLLVLANALPRREKYQLLRVADGLVLYSEAKQKLVLALRAICDGHLWLPSEILEGLARLAQRDEKDHLTFTPREADLVPLIAEGLTNKEIASRLGITEKTVKFHTCNLFAKLGVHDRNSALEAVHTLSALEKYDFPRMQQMAKCA